MGSPPPQHLLDLDWERPSPECRSVRRNMEDPKAWKPRKAWHLNLKERGTQKSTIGRIESKAKLQGGSKVGVRYHNGLV